MKFILFLLFSSCQYSGLNQKSSNSTISSTQSKKTLNVHSFFFATNTPNDRLTFNLNFQTKFQQDNIMKNKYILGLVESHDSYFQEPISIISDLVNNSQENEINHIYLFFSVDYPNTDCTESGFPSLLLKPFSSVPNITYFLTHVTDPLKLARTKVFIIRTQGDFGGYCGPEKAVAANSFLSDLTGLIPYTTNTFYGSDERAANDMICEQENENSENRRICFTNYIRNTFIEDVFLSL